MVSNVRFLVNRFIRVSIAALGLTVSLSGCDKEAAPSPTPPVITPIGAAGLWVTLGDQSRLLTKETDITIVEASTSVLPVINIDASQKLQEIEGFGAALTGSSAYLINKKMSSNQRNNLLDDLFDPETGIGISYLRVTMGASDFSLEDFTYDDIPVDETDFELAQFSIANDEDDVIPVLQEIIDRNPDINIMATPWSPPAWMKTNKSLKSVDGLENKLRTDCYDVYADYFVKYIDAYAAHGIAIDAISAQNEPLYSTATYPCMEMQPTEQRDFIKNNLGPAFEEASIDTKIIVYDHNWDHPEYATTILNDAAAKEYVTGSAFHAYGGNVSAMTTVHNAHPDRGLYFTEISGGEWATDFSDNLQWMMANIFIGTTKNWSKNALLWNLALDQNHGPKNNGCGDCRGVVTINSSSGSVVRNVEYYSIGHFSKFIGKGAHRIASSVSAAIANVDHVAFVNEDGERVLIMANDGSETRRLAVKDGGAMFTYSLLPESVVTIVWKL